MTSGKSFITAFTSSSPRQPIDPVGQASSARNACRRSVLEPGWALTKDVAAASPKIEGAICRQASQSMQVESTKKSPGTFSATRFLEFAMIEPPSPSFYSCGRFRDDAQKRRLSLASGPDTIQHHRRKRKAL